MRVAYLTTDEVNEAEARLLAEKQGITLCPLAPRDGPPGNEYEAVLYDWDSWPADRRHTVMAELLAGPVPHAVAVHGYNLDDEAGERLRRHTIAVYRRLQRRVFRFLRRAAATVRAAREQGRTPLPDGAM
jgi:hypothetical protein